MKYFLGRAIYIYIYILSDCVRILVTSQSEKLDQQYGRYGDQEILLATAKLFYSKQRSFGPVASNKQERKIIDTKTIVGCVICLSEVRFSSSFHRQILSFPWNL